MLVHFAKFPDKVPHHSGKWIVGWIFSIPLLIESNFILLVMSLVSIPLTYLASRLFVRVGILLRKTDWIWLPRIFVRPRLDVWDALILNWSMVYCFIIPLFLFIYSVLARRGMGDPVANVILKWCQWLFYIGVIVLWLKWTVSRHYNQIEEWIDSIWGSR